MARDHPEEILQRSKKYLEWCKNNPDKLADQGRRYLEWRKNNPNKVNESKIKMKLFYKEHPDVSQQRGKKYSKWCKDHPDRVKEIGVHRSEYLANHPESIKELSIKQHEWCVDNSDKVLERSNKCKQWYKDNPDKAKELGSKISNFYRENPDKAKEIGSKISSFYKNNPDKAKELGYKISSWRNNHRLELLNVYFELSNQFKQKCAEEYDFNLLLEALHPDDVKSLVEGDISSADSIRTKCSNCGKLSMHTLNNVFTMKTGKLKLGRLPLCEECRNSLTASHYEQEIAEFVSTFYNGILIRNTRQIISPLELDLYIPDKHIAIEFNGDYWHSSEFKDKQYHYYKFKKCKESGILLVSIFESEWNSRKEEIKSYLVDLFNGKENKLSFNDRSYFNEQQLPVYKL